MSEYKGPVGEVSNRTPRQRAEEIGADPEGFTKAPNYNVQGGHPIMPGYPDSTYSHKDTEPTAGGKTFDPAPFTVTKK